MFDAGEDEEKKPKCGRRANKKGSASAARRKKRHLFSHLPDQLHAAVKIGVDREHEGAVGDGLHQLGQRDFVRGQEDDLFFCFFIFRRACECLVRQDAFWLSRKVAEARQPAATAQTGGLKKTGGEREATIRKTNRKYKRKKTTTEKRRRKNNARSLTEGMPAAAQ